MDRDGDVLAPGFGNDAGMDEPCPYCPASSGEPCRTSSGNPLPVYLTHSNDGRYMRMHGFHAHRPQRNSLAREVQNWIAPRW